MSADEHASPPGGLPAAGPPRLRGSHVFWGAQLLALAVLVLTLAFVWYERREQLLDEQRSAGLMARVLEDHATRSVDTVSLVLAALAELAPQPGAAADAAFDVLVNQSTVGMPVLRGVAVLDAQGRVLAASQQNFRGLAVDLSRLGPLPTEGAERLGPWVAGRGLEALSRGTPPPAPRGMGFLPLIRHTRTRSGQPLLLLGLINPDALSNHQQLVLSATGQTAVLASLEGLALAASGGAQVEPGRALPPGPVFSTYLPLREHASYQGAGVLGADQVVSFRASRTRPLVVIIERPVDEVLAAWWVDSQLHLLLGTAASMGLALLGLLAARSLRASALAQAQRDEAQAAVALRERELSVIVKSVQEILFRTDAAGRLTFVNARWLAATGLPATEALGRPLAEFVRPESRSSVRSLFAERGPSGVRTTAVRVGPGNDARYFDVAVAPLHDGLAVVGWAGSAVEVTEQRHAQARLQAQLAFTELLLDVMPVPMAILDTHRRLVSVNQAWTEFTGFSRSEVLGRPVGEYQPMGMRALHEAHDRELLADGGRRRYEAAAPHRDGSLRDLAFTKAAIPGADGRPTGVLVAFTDVTEFREAERATREARDAAEEASNAKTEFIANISHELRTPLQAIIGFSELGQVRSTQEPRLGVMFKDIHAAGQRMLALVNDLLDVARIESTVGTFHLERVDVRSLVRDVVGELAPLIGARQLRLDLQLGDAPLQAKVDPLRFQQVVRNVLANAIRFSPPSSALHVWAELDDTQHVHLAVRDEGPGIPPDELDKIFEAFVQSSKTKDGSGGTGLGLAISRKIVQAHGGDIRAENNPEGGATFHLRLPARGFAPTLPSEA